MSTLKGKTALVTGSTSGIGLGMAIALAKQGVNIMVNGFGEKDEAIAKIKACGVEVDYHGADMSKPAEIEDLIKQTEKRFGSLDILVNNAGIQYTANIEDFPTDKWDAIIAINLSSAFHTTHHALPGMKQRNWGRSWTPMLEVLGAREVQGEGGAPLLVGAGHHGEVEGLFVDGEAVLAAIHTYGDTVHIFVERKNYKGIFLPGYKPWKSSYNPTPTGPLCCTCEKRPDKSKARMGRFGKGV